jgi:cytochrome P450/NADPH-cytochrome P450 reductase
VPSAPAVSGSGTYEGAASTYLAQARPGTRVALLFFGCGHPDVDYLYRDEWEAWAKEGVVDLFRRGATLYVCGDGRRMAPAVHDTCTRICAEATGASAEEAEAWMTRLEREHGRYVADVFA